MEVRTIETFLRVAELQNFSKAAGQLGYSQATVTVQIRQLEEELGTLLFERIGRRVKLTERGERFIPYAMQFLRAAQDARGFIHESEEPAGALRIGTAESLYLSVLSPLLLQYHEEYPGVSVSIHTGRIAELFDMVRQNDVDLLFFLDKKTDFPEWVKVMEQPEPIVFVASAAHPLAGKKNVPLGQIVREPLVLTEKGVSYRYDLEQRLAAEDLELHPFLEVGNTDAIVKTLLHTASISFLPLYVVRERIGTGELCTIEVSDFKVRMWSQLVYHRNKWVTPQMQRLISLMQDSLAGHT